MKKYTFNPIVVLDNQFFAGSADDFDVEAADALIEQEEVAEEVAADSLVPEAETEETEEEPLEVGEDEVEQETDITTDDGRNAAFAQLRRERDDFASDAKFIRDFAAANGMSVEELRKQHEHAQLEKQAEEKGVSVEIMQRLSDVERENSQVKEQAQAERFNAQVQSTLAKYSGTKADFDATIQYMAQNNMLDAVKSGSVPFEAAYKLANMDTMIEDAKRNAVQDDLSTRKKRQQEATIPAGTQTQAAVTDEIDALVDADTKAILEEYNF